MFDIGWSEMAIIMLLALIIIGPKDLPRVARTIGQWVRKGRALAREFQTSLEDMARDTELDDVRKEIEKVGRTDFKKSIEKTIDPKGDLAKAFDTSDIASDKAKPALTDRDALADKTASSEKSNGAVNGHAGGVTTPTPSEKSAQAASSTSLGAGTTAAKASAAKAAPSKAASTSKPAAKPKTAKSAAKPGAAKKPAATRKTASSTAKSPAKPAAPRAKAGATQNGVAKPAAAKPGAEPSPADDGDNSAAAAKPS